VTRSKLRRIVAVGLMAAAATMLWPAVAPAAGPAAGQNGERGAVQTRATRPSLVLKGKLRRTIKWGKLPVSVQWDGRKAGNINPSMRAVYRGQTLYKLVGMVDDKNPKKFNVKKARKGYKIRFICTDGYKRTIKSRSIIGKKTYIIARLKSGRPLPVGEGPYRYVGGFIKPFYGKDSARMIKEIRLIF
jgi:hypothetical protein